MQSKVKYLLINYKKFTNKRLIKMIKFFLKNFYFKFPPPLKKIRQKLDKNQTNFRQILDKNQTIFRQTLDKNQTKIRQKLDN